MQLGLLSCSDIYTFIHYLSRVENEETVAQLIERELLQRAVNASTEGITISDMSQPDQPLIFVNEGFQKLTGYTWSDVIGKNCRFLQGVRTDPTSVQKLRNAISQGAACKVDLLNYRKDGTAFWNRLSITPIKNKQGVVTHYVGIQSDITVRKHTKVQLESANRILNDFRRRIVGELDQAKMLQTYLLPVELPAPPCLKFAAKFATMDEIGGDFYDVFELPDSKYGLLIADVTGHGIPAALLTFMSSTAFKNAARDQISSAETIALTNERLFGKMPDDAFVTMFYAIYDAKTGLLTYTQAGHPEGYVIRSGGQEVIPLRSNDPIIGPFSNDEVHFQESQLTLQQGDKLILYTDAITDVIDRSGKDDAPALQTILAQSGQLELNDLFEHIHRFGLELCGRTTYEDDFTLLGMEVLTNKD